jgi:hypothetical protein
MTRHALHGEDGFALVTVMLVLLVGMIFSTAVLAQAIKSEQGTRRDADSRGALQAAQAGLQRALWQATALSEVTADPASACLSDGAANLEAGPPTQTAGGVGWCPPVTEEIGAGQTVTYMASADIDPAASKITRDLVATGSADGAVRRVRERVSGFDIANLFGDYAVVSLQDLTLANSAEIGDPQLAGNARSNGDISLTGGARICGDATPGPGHATTTKNGSSICAGYSTTPAPEPIELPDPQLPAGNDNANICANGSCPTNGWVNWNAPARTLTLNNNPSVTVRGNVFVLCRVALDNSSRLTFDPIDPNKPVRIYLDSPANCGGQTVPLQFSNNPTLSTTSAAFPAVQFYVLGGPTATTVSIDNRNETLPAQIYAPRSTVRIANNAFLTGGVAAGQVTMTGNVDVRASSNPARLQLGTGVEFTRGPFTECTPQPATGATLSEGC